MLNEKGLILFDAFSIACLNVGLIKSPPLSVQPSNYLVVSTHYFEQDLKKMTSLYYILNSNT